MFGRIKTTVATTLFVSSLFYLGNGRGAKLLAVTQPTKSAETRVSDKTSRAITTVSAPWIRGTNSFNRMRLDPKGHFLAYVGLEQDGLYLVDIKTKAIHEVTKLPVGASFFWSPDGYRLFFREQIASADGSVTSVINAYDAYLHRKVKLDETPTRTGYLTFDPRDLRMQILGPNGIRTKKIYFPDARLAKWQVSQKLDKGKWLATQQGMLWVTDGGFAMKRLEDDGTALDSFDISPDGKKAAWATTGGRVFVSEQGGAPKLISYGADPKWHPKEETLLIAGARMVGNRPINYDIKLIDFKGVQRWLTATQFSDERWPQWHPEGKQLLFTVAKTTDVFLLDFVK